MYRCVSLCSYLALFLRTTLCLSGHPCDRSDPLPPRARPGFHALSLSPNGLGGSRTHAPALHAQRGPHGEQHVCLPSEHGLAGHILWKQVAYFIIIIFVRTISATAHLSNVWIFVLCSFFFFSFLECAHIHVFSWAAGRIPSQLVVFRKYICFCLVDKLVFLFVCFFFIHCSTGSQSIWIWPQRKWWDIPVIISSMWKIWKISGRATRTVSHTHIFTCRQLLTSDIGML